MNDTIFAAAQLGTKQRIRRFTGAEVRRLLVRGTDDPRSRAARRCATRPADWSPVAGSFVRYPARYFEQLARLVFWDMCGESLATIAPRVDGWLIYNRLVDPRLVFALACAHHRIAARLNATPEAYGL